jgi:hypothetical protein
MNRPALRAATFLAFCFAANAAFAAFVPYHDGFNGIPPGEPLNIAPPGWISNNGNVDWVNNHAYGITCFKNSKGCVDLDGSSGVAGLFQNATPFKLLGGHTYELSAEISGNQRGGNPDSFEFGFLKGKTSTLAGVLKSATVTGITSGSLYTLYTLFFTPSSNISAKAFFYDTTGGDNIGPVLDEVRVTSVPLPAAAWLMLSGLAALGAVARRRINGAATA